MPVSINYANPELIKTYEAVLVRQTHPFGSRFFIILGVITLIGSIIAVAEWGSELDIDSQVIILSVGIPMGILITAYGIYLYRKKALYTANMQDLPEPQNKTHAELRGEKIQAKNNSSTALKDETPYILQYQPSKVSQFFQELKTNALSLKKRACVAMFLGCAAGDIAGSDYEHQPFGVGFILPPDYELPAGKPWTDDTSRLLCLAEVMNQSKRKDKCFDPTKHSQSLWWTLHDCLWYSLDRKGPARAGSRSIAALTPNNHSTPQNRQENGNYQTSSKTGYDDPSNKEHAIINSSNGSLMGLAPIVAGSVDPNSAFALAASQSLVTHRGEAAAQTAGLLAWALWPLVNSNEADPIERKKLFFEILSQFELNHSLKSWATSPFPMDDSIESLAKSTIDNDSNDNWNWKDPHYRPNARKDYQKVDPKTLQPLYDKDKNPIMKKPLDFIYAPDALAMALHCVYHTDNFKEAIRMAVRGGDCDTVAAIVGQIAGAIYPLGCEEGIPASWIKNIDPDGVFAASAIVLAGD